MAEGMKPINEEIKSNGAPEETPFLVTNHRMAAPLPPSNNSLSAAEVATQEPTESESEPKEAEEPRRLNTNKPIKTTRLAPNRLVNWSRLQSVVNENLGPCRVCKSKDVRLEETASCSFATTIEVFCKPCNEETERNRKNVCYLTKKMDGMKINTKKEKEERRTV